MNLLRTGGKVILIAAAIAILGAPASARHRHHRLDSYPPLPSTESSSEPSSTSERNVAGQFDYYALVLSWSPSFCAEGAHSGSPQCSPAGARPYSFVLHGLWPQYQKGWPQDCYTQAKPFVPETLIYRMLDIMPARKLVIHEYKKHGTCSGLNPESYFALSRQLYTSIKIPERFQNPAETQTVSPDQLLAEFMQINPDIKPGMIAVSCGGAGDRLKEVHICMSHEGKPAACGRNEVQRKMCSADTMAVLPVRASAEPSEKASWPAAPVAPPKRTLSGALLQYFGRQ